MHRKIMNRRDGTKFLLEIKALQTVQNENLEISPRLMCAIVTWLNRNYNRNINATLYAGPL
jgi:hypothetical protein